MKVGRSVGVSGAAGAALVAHVQQRREAERSTLSRMLHHDVAGMLAAARMDLSRVSSRVADDELLEQLRRVDQLLDQCIRDARREMQHLHPALIDHFGLPLAIRHLIEERCVEAGLLYNMALDDAMEGVDPQVLIAAFRVVEAALGDCGEYGEFNARIAARRDGYLLEIVATPAAGTTLAPLDPVRAADLDALRVWLRTLGAGWTQSARDTRWTIEMRLPRQRAAQTGVAATAMEQSKVALDPIKEETPGG